MRPVCPYLITLTFRGSLIPDYDKKRLARVNLDELVRQISYDRVPRVENGSTGGQSVETVVTEAGETGITAAPEDQRRPSSEQVTFSSVTSMTKLI